ncbi:phenylalanine--tRNA ligase subunit beta [Candidatus Saccharibacteria bacterium]|nr:phenylalanine--tRNA ligase subunit beta [Candidatus Saccharibacteria bacterium]
MRISLNEIKKLVPEAGEIDTQELVKLIGSRLVEVEETINLAPKYQGIYVVKVVECEAIPETHLHLCKIDAGQAAEQINRDNDGLIQVVCGAPNVRAGMLAVWIAPGSIVPQTYGNEDFKLDVRKLRGYESNGMLAAVDELDLGDDHEGIAVINPAEKNSKSGDVVKPGDLFSDVFDLNDVILDIENKSLTHRPDTFGLIGFAREVAGIMGVKFDENRADITNNPFAISSTADNLIKIKIADTTLCSRYSCAIIETDDCLKDDKFFTKMDVFLAKAGMRGISRIVDITNYLMLMTGQPLHAFDFDKFVAVGGIDTPSIIVRSAKNGEKLQLLDGKVIECDENDILITSNDVPVALAGAMGGASTEIDQNTRKIILESATFSLYHLRKTQMKHGIFSEAITRFTKGQPAVSTMPVLESACSMLIPDAKETNDQVITIVDEYPNQDKENVVKITTKEINDLLGTTYTTAIIKKTLENVSFIVEDSSDSLTVIAPLWRTDIHIKEDIIEEVGRLLGYDNIALDYPLHPFACTEIDPMLSLKERIRNILSDRLSAHEVLTYSFVSKKLQESVGEDINDSYEIVNSISPDLQCFRQSLIPSLLEKVYENLKSGHKDFSLYEINQITKKSYGYDNDNVPKLYTHLAFVTTGDYYQMKANLVALLSNLGFDESNLDFRKYDGHFSYLEPQHSATISTPHVCCGEVKTAILKRLKIDQGISAYEIVLEHLIEDLPTSSAHISAISKYPTVERDLTMRVADSYTFAQTNKAINNALNKVEDITYKVYPVSIYQPEDNKMYRNLSFRIQFANLKKTLTSAEISAIMDSITKSVKEAVGAEII